MKRFAQKFFDKRNLLSLIMIFIGLLSLFEIPQNLGLTYEQLVLGMLSFIALESVIVNLGYLDRLNEMVEQIVAKAVRPSIDDILAPRDNRFELEGFTKDAIEVLIMGVSLENLVMHQANLLAKLAGRRCRMRFVVIDPCSSFLEKIDYGMPNYVGKQVLESNILAGITRMAQLYRSLSPAQRKLMEVRKYEGIPFYSGIRIVTRGNAPDFIWVSFYSYGGAIGERRGVLVNSQNSPKNYDFYNQALNRLWEASAFIDIKDFTVSVE